MDPDDKDKEIWYGMIFDIVRNMLAGIGVLAMFVIAMFLYGYRS